MEIVHTRCTQCRLCIPYCPMRAIRVNPQRHRVEIDAEECVECGTCRRSAVCTVDALVMPQLEWPRVLRQRFSNPLVTHPDTNVPGRGTEEMKTNEVTGRYKCGSAGMAVEMGRPATGTRFRDVEKMTTALATLRVHFDPLNPVTCLMTDTATGKIRRDVLNEKVLSAIIGFDVGEDSIPVVLETIRKAAPQVDTVFSVCLTARLRPDGSNTASALSANAGFTPSPNGKTNVGLGRPLAEDRP